MTNKKFLNYFKPKKSKIFLSLIPFYFLIILTPFLLEIIPSSFLENTTMGNYMFGLITIIYFSFLIMAYPLEGFLISSEFMNGGHGWLPIPEITFPGLVILSLIYSILIYLIISFISYLRR